MVVTVFLFFPVVRFYYLALRDRRREKGGGRILEVRFIFTLWVFFYGPARVIDFSLLARVRSATLAVEEDGRSRARM